MKRNFCVVPIRLLGVLLAASVASGASQAQAGFIMEGLQPFSVRACPDGQAFADPIVAAPRSSVSGTPSRYNDGGIPRFQPQNCPSARGGKGSSQGGQKWSVPQK